jgi:hypothetical protein
MRPTPLVLSLCLAAPMAFVAAAARVEAALISTPLIEGEFIWEPSDDIDHEACTISVDGGSFSAQVAIDSLDGSMQEVSLSFDTLQPTSVTRGSDKLAVKQSQWVSLTLAIGGSQVLGQIPVEKCSLSSSFGLARSKGVATLSCKGDDLSQLLGPSAIGSVKSAMANLKHVKFKVDAARKKWSLSTACAGVFTP